MAWTTIKAIPSLMLEGQDMLRWQNKPVCSVKRGAHYWRCSLLNLDGISTRSLELPLTLSIEEVRAACEDELRRMGWTEKEERNV